MFPGIKFHVLGPPTLRQSSGIRKQRTEDDNEFWKFQAAASKRFSAGGTPLFPSFRTYPKHRTIPLYARWFIPRMLNMHVDQLLEIVRVLDGQMNNTSIILLIETPNKKLLFAGDAQIENWLYALKESPQSAEIVKLLADVDLYKVGPVSYTHLRRRRWSAGLK